MVLVALILLPGILPAFSLKGSNSMISGGSEVVEFSLHNYQEHLRDVCKAHNFCPTISYELSDESLLPGNPTARPFSPSYGGDAYYLSMFFSDLASKKLSVSDWFSGIRKLRIQADSSVRREDAGKTHVRRFIST
jgi:hypothetical protein